MKKNTFCYFTLVIAHAIAMEPNSIVRVTNPNNLWPILQTRLEEAPRPILFVTDVDNTICRPRVGRSASRTNGTIGDNGELMRDNVYEANVRIRQALIPDSQLIDSYQGNFSDHIRVMKDSEVEPVGNPKVLIERLREQLGALVIASSARSMHYRPITERHLKKDLGIDFEPTLDTMSLPYFEASFSTEPRSTFQGGVIYSAAMPKWLTLQLAKNAIKKANPSFHEPKVIAVIDDKRYHLEDLLAHKSDSTELVLIHLDLPEAPLTTLTERDQLAVAREALKLPLEQYKQLAKNPKETLGLLRLTPNEADAVLTALFNIPLPKLHKPTQKNLEEIIDTCLGYIHADKKEQIIKVLAGLHSRVKHAAPMYKYISHQNETYLAIYQVSEAKRELMVDTKGCYSYKHVPVELDENGDPICVKPLLIPVKYIYPGNKELLQRFIRSKDDLPWHPKPIKRATSYLDTASREDTPPGSPLTTEPTITSPLTASGNYRPRFESLTK